MDLSVSFIIFSFTIGFLLIYSILFLTFKALKLKTNQITVLAVTLIIYIVLGFILVKGFSTSNQELAKLILAWPGLVPIIVVGGR